MAGEEKQVNDFRESLDWSINIANDPFWDKFYGKLFPGMEWHMVCSENCQGQHLGIDRIVYLKSGQIRNIQEKVRKNLWPDILLEFISNDKHGTPGWMEKPLLIDYLVYVFWAEKKGYVFDWAMLRRAWLHFRDKWLEKYKIIDSQNEGYVTKSVAVPIDVLCGKVNAATIIEIPEKEQ